MTDAAPQQGKAENRRFESHVFSPELLFLFYDIDIKSGFGKVDGSRCFSKEEPYCEERGVFRKFRKDGGRLHIAPVKGAGHHFCVASGQVSLFGEKAEVYETAVGDVLVFLPEYQCEPQCLVRCGARKLFQIESALKNAEIAFAFAAGYFQCPEPGGALVRYGGETSAFVVRFDCPPMGNYSVDDLEFRIFGAEFPVRIFRRRSEAVRLKREFS